MNKMIALVSGVAMVIGAGAANAAEPMKLTAAEMDGVTAGCGYCVPTFSFSKVVVTYVDTNVNIDKNVYSSTYVNGNLADAEATAQSFGYDSLAETLTFTTTDSYSSVAYSSSVSATN